MFTQLLLSPSTIWWVNKTVVENIYDKTFRVTNVRGMAYTYLPVLEHVDLEEFDEVWRGL